jgi:2-oxo-3-hexenedioate decarboxylase
VSNLDRHELARELMAACAGGTVVPHPPSARDPEFDLASAYAVEAELVALRRANGHATVGRKVGYANKVLWRALKLDTLVWAHMYDDTVRYAESGVGAVSLVHRISPRIEPEIVFKLKSPVPPSTGDATAVLEAVEWFALGFEIIDCVFPEWKYQPADFVAAFGLHVGLVVGEPLRVGPETIASLVEQLPQFTIKLLKNEQVVAEGSGRNSLRSPALCLAELASAIGRHAGADPLVAGELVSSGSLTAAQPIAPGEKWRATVNGLPVADLTVHT